MLTAVADEPGRQAVVVFSDGVDRYSQTRAGTLLEQARRSRALVYPIAIGRTRPPVLAEIAAASGGRSVLVPTVGALDAALRTLSVSWRFVWIARSGSLKTSSTPTAAAR